jgi:alpha-mannosidase
VNTGRVVEHLDRTSPVIMSWALNNHWFVNFKAQQDGQIRLRYSLTSMPGHIDVNKAMRFSAEVRTPPVILRDRRPFSLPNGEVGRVLEGADVVVGSKVSEDGTGLVVRLLNFKSDDQRVTVDMGNPLRGAWTVLPDEREDAPIATDGSAVTISVGPRCTKSLLLKW